jgi:hypothetical protein
MQTYPIKDKVNSQVTFEKATHKAINAKAQELGVTRSRVINTIMTDALAVQKTAVVEAKPRKTILRKAKK